MNQEKTFFVNSAIDFSESGTYSLVDNTLSNAIEGSKVVPDLEITFTTISLSLI